MGTLFYCRSVGRIGNNDVVTNNLWLAVNYGYITSGSYQGNMGSVTLTSSTSGSDVILAQTSYAYNGTDNSGRLYAVLGNSGTSGTTTTLGYQAGTDDLVNSLSTSVFGVGTASGGTLTTDYSYNMATGRLTGETVMNGTVSVYTETLTYGEPDGSHSQQIGEKSVSYTDAWGRIGAYYTLYAYNQYNQLTSAATDVTEQHGSVVNYTSNEYFTYDAVGNLVSSGNSSGTLTDAQMNYTTNALNQITGIHTTTWGGSVQTTATPTWDGDGNMTSDGQGDVFTYDGINQLTQVLMADGTLVQYAYDQNGRVVDRKEFDAGGTSSGTGYAYDGSDLIAEFDGTTGRIEESLTWAPDPQGVQDHLVGITTYDSSGLVNAIYRPFYNNHQDVAGLVDQGGNVAATYTYSAFGVQFASGPAANVCPVGWDGYYYDPVANLYFSPNRVYSAPLSQFLQRDPSGEFNGGPNLYAYGGRDPVNNTDPTGLEPPMPPPESGAPDAETSGRVPDYVPPESQAEREQEWKKFDEGMKQHLEAIKDYQNASNAARAAEAEEMNAVRRAHPEFTNLTPATLDRVVKAFDPTRSFNDLDPDQQRQIFDIVYERDLEKQADAIEALRKFDEANPIEAAGPPSSLRNVSPGDLPPEIRPLFEPVLRDGMSKRVVNGTPIYGDAQNTTGGNPDPHATTVDMAAEAMARNGDYEFIILNRSVRTASNRESDIRERPDVVGRRKDGRFDMIEVLSPGQTKDEQDAKLRDINNRLPADLQGRYNSIPINYFSGK